MTPKRDDDFITKRLKTMKKEGRGQQHRLSRETEALLQCAIARIKQIEKQEDEKLTQFRKSGVGVSSDEIIEWALRIVIENNEGILGRTQNIKDREMLQGEKDALKDWITEPTDAQIIKRRKEKLLRELGGEE